MPHKSVRIQTNIKHTINVSTIRNSTTIQNRNKNAATLTEGDIGILGFAVLAIF